MNGADVRVVQCRRGFGFTPKSFQRLVVVRQVLRLEFQRHEAVEAYVPGFVHYAHASTTKFFNNAIVGYGLAWKRLGVGHRPVILLCDPPRVNDATPLVASK